MHLLKKLCGSREKLFLLCAVLAVGCLAAFSGSRQVGEEHVAINGGARRYEPVFSATKADVSVDEDEAVFIDLGESAEECRIEAGGAYLLSGELKGRLCIDAEEQIVHLILSDVSISALSGPAILVRSAGKVIITLQEGSENQVKDSGQYPAVAEENACIYSMCDLTINGTGSLSIYGYYKDGIHSRDVVKLLGGQIAIQAKRDGIRGNDGVMMQGGRLDIQSEGTGIRTTKSGRAGKGAIEISGGTLSVIAGEYGVLAVSDLWVCDCGVTVKGITGNLHAQGNMYVQEECLEDESVQA